MKNYVFSGKLFDDTEIHFCISAETIDDAWMEVALNYGQFYMVTLISVT